MVEPWSRLATVVPPKNGLDHSPGPVISYGRNEAGRPSINSNKEGTNSRNFQEPQLPARLKAHAAKITILRTVQSRENGTNPENGALR